MRSNDKSNQANWQNNPFPFDLTSPRPDQVSGQISPQRIPPSSTMDRNDQPQSTPAEKDLDEASSST